jgi:NADH-quinone oxidoreductase subunit J
MFETYLFYFFALILVFAGTMVILVKNPVHAALFLVLAFFTSAAVWMLLEAEFLAITLVLVYVGAVMVLFLFVVMMLDINITALRAGFARYFPLAGIVAALMVLAIRGMVGSKYFGLDRVAQPKPHPADYSNTRELGLALYTDYIYPFEVAGVILLVAIVAAITLTMRRRLQVKTQKPHEQMAVRRQDRVRLVKVPAEKA